MLELGLTESAMVEDSVRVGAVLRELSALGFTLTVDDFGTGYTSMAQLEQMPLSTLKIDRSFVSRMLVDSSGAVLVRAIVELGHDLGMRVVAEGVEEEAVRDRLVALGCDVAQGYLWSRAVPGSELLDVLSGLQQERTRIEDAAAAV